MAKVLDMVLKGNPVDTFVSQDQVDYLYQLHANCWLEMRFYEDGVYLETRSAGGLKGGVTIDPSSSGSRSSRDSNPIDPKTGLAHSTRMKMAMLEQEERYLQLRMLDGELDVEVDSVPCLLLPLTKELLKELLDEDNFPYELTPANM
ncbi:hypothetical protein KC19_1G322400 [Ceratodon purpureus]|uniref:Uncharacterized protein n=1 Tax=Ceratodon purpureus TaxID=3225 RepID=A0A8T0JD02_CERPU|nr:hypothetical protein KC19_1G322400 [Ceratodon purpureus]